MSIPTTVTVKSIAYEEVAVARFVVYLSGVCLRPVKAGSQKLYANVTSEICIGNSDVMGNCLANRM